MVTVVLRQQLGGRHHRLDLLNHSLRVWVFARLMCLGLCVCRMRMCEREMKKGVSCSFSPLVSPRDVFSAREVTAADASTASLKQELAKASLPFAGGVGGAFDVASLGATACGRAGCAHDIYAQDVSCAEFQAPAPWQRREAGVMSLSFPRPYLLIKYLDPAVGDIPGAIFAALFHHRLPGPRVRM